MPADSEPRNETTPPVGRLAAPGQRPDAVIGVDAALELVLAQARPLGSEEVPLPEALGRILAADVASDVDMPPFDRSAMDGYALRAQDVQALPATLAVVAQVRAGEMPRARVEAGQAIQIMTGAPVPEGATAVQPVEKTRAVDGGSAVTVLEPVEPGANVARKGSEVQAGQVVLQAGTLVTPATIAVLAASGVARVAVARRPRVSLVVTGDELVDVDTAPRHGQIRNCNGYALVAQARQAGAEVVDLGVVRDDADAIADAVGRGLAADVFMASGGVSEGVYDLVEPALQRLGVELVFTRVALKPGAPLVFGRRGSTLVFGLPGNPVSAQVTFDVFVRPALLCLQGARDLRRTSVVATLASPLKNRSGRRALSPARLSWREGRFVAEPLRSQGSADIAAHARANALLVMEPTQVTLEAGEAVPAVLLDPFLLS